MKADYHVHSTYCDGKNTPREIAEEAVRCGMDALGFSSHAHKPDSHCGMTLEATENYIAEVSALKVAYADRIQIYLGTEEDSTHLIDRSRYDYIIGSKHFFVKDGTHYSIDGSFDRFQRCMEVFDFDALALADAYYSDFCAYVECRRPDIIGHFDLITKFDEQSDASLFLKNERYYVAAEKYARRAARTGCLFEVNTGALSRGYRTMPYPSERLLHVLLKEGAGVVLTSDAHRAEHLAFAFDEARALLRDVGFSYTYVFYDGRFQKNYI